MERGLWECFSVPSCLSYSLFDCFLSCHVSLAATYHLSDHLVAHTIHSCRLVERRGSQRHRFAFVLQHPQPAYWNGRDCRFHAKHSRLYQVPFHPQARDIISLLQHSYIMPVMASVPLLSFDMWSWQFKPRSRYTRRAALKLHYVSRHVAQCI